MNLVGIRYGSVIQSAAAAHGLNPTLLAAVAAQETGGPGSDSGKNVVGDGGHGHGLFQIDDRSWAFARTPAAMDPARNADVAASILRSNLDRFGGDVGQALSAYNSGSPTATGTATTWPDGQTLSYADSVMRHYGDIVASQHGRMVADARENAAGVNALAALGATQIPTSAAPPPTTTGSTVQPLPTLPPMPPMPQPPLPSSAAPPPGVPVGSQAQAATSVGAQADHDEAALIDGGDVFDRDASVDD